VPTPFLDQIGITQTVTEVDPVTLKPLAVHRGISVPGVTRYLTMVALVGGGYWLWRRRSKRK